LLPILLRPVHNVVLTVALGGLCLSAFSWAETPSGTPLGRSVDASSETQNATIPVAKPSGVIGVSALEKAGADTTSPPGAEDEEEVCEEEEEGGGGASVQVDEIIPMETDRPDFTESSIVVPPGSLQFENGFTYEMGDGAQRTSTYPETLLRVGLTKRVEARVGLPNGPSRVPTVRPLRALATCIWGRRSSWGRCPGGLMPV